MVWFRFQEDGVNYRISTMYLLEQNPKAISSKLDDSMDHIYGKCFYKGGNATYTRNSMQSFVGQRGINVIVATEDDTVFLVLSLTPNPSTRCIEIYNVCKNLEESRLRTSRVLYYLMRYFVRGIPQFQGYTHARLSVIYANDYLIPLLGSYSEAGFSVDDTPQQLSSYQRNIFTMTCSLARGEQHPKSMRLAVQKALEQIQITPERKQYLLHSIVNRLPKIEEVPDCPEYDEVAVIESLPN